MSGKEVERIPLWLAVAFSAAVSVPFGTLLGDYSIALWASFIAWAEYFAFGSSSDQLKWICGLFPLGALTMAVFATFNNYATDILAIDLIASSTILLFIFVAAAVYLLTLIPQGMDKSLAYFNGVSMFLAFSFAGIVGGPGLGGGPVVEGSLSWLVNPWIRWIWVSLAGIYGGFLGWFNILITFPTIKGQPVEIKTWEWLGVVTTVLLSVSLWVLYHPWFNLLEGSATQHLVTTAVVGLIIAIFTGKAILDGESM